MRILHVAESFGAGVLSVVLALTERQARDGHEVAIAYGVQPETPSEVRAAVHEGVALVPTWEGRTAAGQVRAVRRLRRLAAGFKPDVAHLHSSFSGMVGTLALDRSVPTVYSPHSFAFTRCSDGGVRRAAYRACDRFVCSRASAVGVVSRAEAVLARELAPRARVDVVLNGIPDLDEGRAPGAGLRRGPRVVSMGRAGAQRRPEAAGRILGRLTDIAEVAWIGGGTRTDAGVAALRARGVPVTGWLEREQALAELGRATAYLHWSAWDGASLAILEAMARDVVVVASDIEPNRELVGPGQVCDHEDDAVELLRRVIEDGPLRESLLLAQRERRSHYGAERMAREWCRVYEDLSQRWS